MLTLAKWVLDRMVFTGGHSEDGYSAATTDGRP